MADRDVDDVYRTLRKACLGCGREHARGQDSGFDNLENDLMSLLGKGEP